MGNLLYPTSPLVVNPDLAKLIGLNEAIVLQQLHYWLKKSNNTFNGRKWAFNTYDDWQKQFKWWSSRTVRRTFTSLIKQGLVITGNFNKKGYDKTKWYSIDYEKLEQLVDSPCGQNGHIKRTDCPHPSGQNDQTNTRDYTEITTETNKTTMSSSDEHDRTAQKVIDYLNQKTSRHYRNTNANLRLIKARIKDGFVLSDFIVVIDNKVSQWGNDPKMQKYLRPATLFNASKFEGYLNERTVERRGSDVDGLF
ncbi:conserved phage C-terminal domain-containing protein (plasmid) [Fructilactobacillus ixorae]|uniref:Conserved phage C-terminal domain-containing protein n=1 Tax=Fructilactobacillus ixorae TaxID=1750535 RepID=A0ABY5C9J0_9LACO|nr:conserved phage C-terminal domain-containing protein [Fructilactobacillus ixorae]USS93976.1 conserved phage C-terminal domain-containing protein [Fructilactobacillus ixorae]